VALYASNSTLAPEIRPTEDVDVVVESATYGGHSVLEERLRDLGFENDNISGIICRYLIKGIVVDVMPVNDNVFGFTNRWYTEGFGSAVDYKLDVDTTIKIFSLPYFIATKWEAFKGRGKGDYRTSKDFEDIAYVIENAADFVHIMEAAPSHLKQYFQQEFTGIIHTDDFEEGLYAHSSRGYGGG